MARSPKLIRWLSVAAGLSLFISACGSGSGAQSLEELDPVTLDFTMFVTEKSSLGQAAQTFADEVSEGTDGVVTVEPYYSGSLVAAGEELGAVRDGLADIGLMLPAYSPQELPVVNWYQRLGFLASDEYPLGMLSGSATIMQLNRDVAALKDEWEANNIKLLFASQVNMSYNLLCTSAVESLDDVEGLRVRASGGVWTEQIEGLGMVPVQLTAAEQYEGLQRGVIDCVTGAPDLLMSSGLLEVAKHFVPIQLNPWTFSPVGMNLDSWNELPPDAQEVLLDAAHVMWMQELELQVKTYQDFLTASSENDIVWHDPSAIDAELEQVNATILEEQPSLAPSTVEDPEGAAPMYEESLATWESEFSPLIEASGTGDVEETWGAEPTVDYDALLERSRELFSDAE